MRIQIMHLPAPADEHPFALVVDGVGASEVSSMQRDLERAKEHLGALAVVAFENEIEVI